MIIRSLAVLFLLTAYYDSYCQVKDYPFSRLDVRDGLSDSHVNTIYQDNRGYLWFGTMSGLNRYDGYSLKVFRHDDADSSSLSDDYIQNVFEGPEGRLYVNAPAGGINIYDPLTQQFIPHIAGYLQKHGLPRYGLVSIVSAKDSHYYFIYRDSGIYRFNTDKGATQLRPGKGQSCITTSPVSGVALDSEQNLWLSHENGLLQKIDLVNNKCSAYDISKALHGRFGYKLFIDRQDKIWVFSPGSNSGVLEFDPYKGVLLHFCRDSGQIRLSSNIVSDVAQDDKGQIWMATDQGGIIILDKTKLTVRYLLHSDEERSLPENTITTLYKDNTGIIWAGTYKNGICYYHPNMLRFPLYRRQPGLSSSLPYNDVNCFAEDKGGNIWIGTNGSGLIYFDRLRNTFTRYQHDARNYNSLACDAVVVLMVDHEGKLWIGTYQGGLDCFDGHKFIHYKHNDADPGSLSDDNVYAIREEAGGDLWIGTLMGGLDRLDKQKNSFYHNSTAKPYSLHSNYISSLAYDTDLNLWIGTAYGIDVLRRNTGKYEYYTRENSKLSDNIVYGLHLDYRGNMWVATRQGLSVLQPGKDSFQVFHTSDGLPSNTIMNVQEDNDHFLWVSTSGGISRIAVSEEGGYIGLKCINYDEYDGLQGREFNQNAGLKTNKGEMLFGGGNGFNLFTPASIVRDGHILPVVLTGFRLFNKEVPLPPSVPGEGKLVLSYDENSFSLEFAALSYINALKNKYLYRLDGFDKDWMAVDGRGRRATYTNIEPGDYVFRVRASNGDGVWNERGISVHIIVKPPFWKTGWAYTIYFLFILAALYLARHQIIKRARARFALAEERREALRVRELDRMKIKFITNLSHEFRTPLSLILAPADKLIKGAEDAGRKQLGMLIERNAKRLLHLVNQLLDLRKMEVNELKLSIGPGDIAGFIKETTDSFADLAEQKGITLSYKSTVDHLPAWFDRDKIERILFNLLSNAFKFTSAGGAVIVELSIAEQEENSVLLELRVKDTGIGIPEALQGKIFESFFQGELPGHILNQGTGIGLAITREFIEMHGGTIKVESSPGNGSCFTVLLPVTLVAGKSSLPAIPGTISAPAEQGILEEADNDDMLRAPELQGKHLRILLVEDDEDFRFYLKDNLAPLFTIVEAANGKEGWQKTLSAHPDLVVTDVNMPIMDGLELCRKIKTDPRTRHIPVVLLTALSGDQEQLRALGAGANDYVSKPFNVEILVSRIRNLLEYKGSMEQTFKRRIEVNPREIEVEQEATAEDFIREAVNVLEKHIENADFSIDDWSRELHLSRTTLYKKIVAGTGKTPIGFIRSFRLRRAAQLLEKSRHNVTEVAYMVGFNNPKYFARYFKEEFGKLPSVYQAEKRKKD